MHHSQPRGSSRAKRFPRIAARSFSEPHSGRRLFSVPLILLSALPTCAQDTRTAATEFFGKGIALTVVVHDATGNPIPSPAMVKLLRGGTIPAGQAETERGSAELVANDLGEFTIEVQAPGYANAQKEVSINANGRAVIDVYLRSLSANSPGGRPVLAPKAKKAVDDGFDALAANNLSRAQKHANQAMSLAPGHPDVLYLQGVVLLKQRDWAKAQKVLEKATQVDPSHANAFSALGMALCDQGKYDAAIVPLEKALKLNPETSWDARWTLARAYYQQAQYDQALAMSQTALSSSHGRAPEIELLVAQSLTALGRYDDAAQGLREFVRDHPDRREAATAHRWLAALAASGKIKAH